MSAVNTLLLGRRPIALGMLLVALAGPLPFAFAKGPIRAQDPPPRPPPDRADARAPTDLAAYRRSDGTLDWSRLAADLHAPRSSVQSFSLVFFFQELAVALRTGQAERIGELFDGLANSRFFIDYGLFSLAYVGAGDVYAQAIDPALMQALRGSFIRGALRSQLAIAAGMALPRLATGSFSGKVYAIDLAAMGLSTVAVKAALQGAGYLVKLNAVAPLMRAVGRAAGLGGVAGWLYEFGEMAIIFYFGDRLSTYAQQALDEWAQERTRSQAGARLQGTTASDDGEGFEAALSAVGEVWAEHRARLYLPLVEGERRSRATLEQAVTSYHSLALGDRRLRDLRDSGLLDNERLARLSAELLAKERLALQARLERSLAQDGQRRLQALHAAYAQRLPSYAQEEEVYQAALARTPGTERRTRLTGTIEALRRTRAIDEALYLDLARAEASSPDAEGITAKLQRAGTAGRP